jgi:hypothetical protein
MKHSDKVKLERKMRSYYDIATHQPIFGTENWEKRKQAIRARVEKQIAKQKAKKAK